MGTRNKASGVRTGRFRGFYVDNLNIFLAKDDRQTIKQPTKVKVWSLGVAGNDEGAEN